MTGPHDQLILDLVRHEERLNALHRSAKEGMDKVLAARKLAATSSGAHSLLTKLADRRREDVRVRVERIVVAALRAVFGPRISFRFDVSVLRGVVAIKPEIGFAQPDGTFAFIGVDRVAGGVVDVLSLALRVSVLLARRPQLRPILIADEPLKHLSDEYLPAAAEMLRRLCDECGLQMLIVSHEPDVSLRAHRVHKVSRTARGSTVVSEDLDV